MICFWIAIFSISTLCYLLWFSDIVTVLSECETYEQQRKIYLVIVRTCFITLVTAYIIHEFIGYFGY